MDPQSIFLEYLRDLAEGRGTPPEQWLEARRREYGDRAAPLAILLERFQVLVALAPPRQRVSQTAADLAASAPDSARTLGRLAARAASTDRYQHKGEIARGGMGAVLEVFDEDLHRQLAMKVLLTPETKPGLSRTPGTKQVARFLEEAQITGQLSHPGIVPVHDLGLDAQGELFFTMQMVKGKHLGQIIALARQRAEGWNPTRVVSVLQRACEALAFAHNKGVLHRDLKPANIMVGRFGETYVMDWGLARLEGATDMHDIRPRPAVEPLSAIDSDRAHDGKGDGELLTMDGDVVGTPSYMAPEQARGELGLMGPRSDVYSMGAVLYELLTGQAPYTVPGFPMSPYMVWRQVLEGQPRPIANLEPRAPAELVAIAERAMARRSEARYPSMEALAEDLRNYLENRVVRAHAAGAWAQLKKWVQRNPLAAGALSAAALVLVTSGFVLAGIERRRGGEQRLQRDLFQAGALLADGQAGFEFSPTGLGQVRRWLGDVESLCSRYPDRGEDPAPGRVDNIKTRALEREIEDNQALQAAFGEQLELAQAASQSLPEDWALAHQDPRREIELIESEIDRRQGLHQSLQLALRQERAEALSPKVPGRNRWLLDARLDCLSDTEGPLARQRAFEARLSAAAGELSVQEQQGWEQARDALAARSGHPDLALPPVFGLVPIGIDSESRLPEFWHRGSGDRPQRDAAGQIALREKDGLVLVALPPGRFDFGPRDSDGQAPYHFELAQPVWISKYELTQGQYLCMTGQTPSTHLPIAQMKGSPRTDWKAPVESVPPAVIQAELARFGLSLPSEPVWEYAALAGTAGPCWFGDLEDWIGQENFRGAEMRHNLKPGEVLPRVMEPIADVDDLWIPPAPVDTGMPNPFGLFQVHGNVMELTADRFSRDLATYSDRNPTTLIADQIDRIRHPDFAGRGGCYSDDWQDCIGTARTLVTRLEASVLVGFRPCLCPTNP